MKSILAVRVARWLGWAAAAASVGVVLGATFFESIAGPLEDQSLWLTPRVWRQLRTTFWMAGATTCFATLLALPAVVALTQASRLWRRRLLLALVVMPLVTMPAVFAYAWMLVATRRDGFAAGLLDLVGWNTSGLEPLQSAWVLATWLWPIPALVMTASFEHSGRVGYQLARLDASAVTAFFRGALPLMRAPLAAALGITFILSATDSTVPPLMGAGNVWAVEMMAQASTAARFDRPVGFLFWQSWPVLALISLVVLGAIPGLREMARWADSTDASDLGGAGLHATRRSSSVGWLAACLVAAGITLFPIVVFSFELSTGRSTPVESFGVALRTMRSDGMATLLVGILTAVLALTMSVAALVESDDRWPTRLAARALTVGVLVAALLPPELTGTALASLFSRISDPTSPWSVYDCTPWTWTAAMLSRYAFLPVCVAHLLNRRVPEALLGQARMDGATGIGRIAHVRLPMLGWPVMAAAMMAGCLALSEVASSVLVQPPRFFGGSLAVKVDMQMHYGRQDETIAMSLMMLVPAVLAAVAAPMLTRGRRVVALRGKE